MNARRLLLAVPVVLATTAAPAAAQIPHTLSAYCTNASVPAGWGNAPGIAMFAYDIRDGFGAGRSSTAALQGWGTGYSDLPCAFWGGGQNLPTWVGEIAAISDGLSNTILLEEITIGRWGGSPRDVEVRVYNDDYSSLLFTGFLNAIDGTSNTLLLGEVVQGRARVQWNDPWWMGVGSVGIVVDPRVALVPEPASLGLTAIGLGALAAIVRRRRA